MAGVIERKREVLTLKEKLEIIECLERGEKTVVLINKYKCGKSTIYDIKKKSFHIYQQGNHQWDNQTENVEAGK